MSNYVCARCKETFESEAPWRVAWKTGYGDEVCDKCAVVHALTNGELFREVRRQPKPKWQCPDCGDIFDTDDFTPCGDGLVPSGRKPVELPMDILPQYKPIELPMVKLHPVQFGGTDVIRPGPGQNITIIHKGRIPWGRTYREFSKWQPGEGWEVREWYVQEEHP